MQEVLLSQSAPSSPYEACDAHVHLFLPEEFPYSSTRQYTPPAATVEELLALHARLGMGRVVLVQPSCYGNDNEALIHGLTLLGASRARGVAVVDLEQTSDAQLGELNSSGVRGVRLNLTVQRDVEASAIRRQLSIAQERCAALGWHIQINADAETVVALAPVFESLRAPVVFDHFAGGLGSADVVSRLLATGRAWVKLSAPYRASRDASYRDLQEVVGRYVQANGQRLVWGSDWPHTGGTGVREASFSDVEPFRQEDALATLCLLDRWVPDEATRNCILASNPAELYGF